jgi:transcriptional regulator with XRE-family HTH domain
VGTTQAAFAQAIGVSVKTLRNWEQRRREPTGPARVLLTLLQRLVFDVANGQHEITPAAQLSKQDVMLRKVSVGTPPSLDYGRALGSSIDRVHIAPAGLLDSLNRSGRHQTAKMPQNAWAAFLTRLRGMVGSHG